MAATKLVLSLIRIDFAVAVSSGAVRISTRAVRVFRALSLRRVRPSYGTFYLMVFQGNCVRGRTGHMIIRFTYHSSPCSFWLASNKTCGTLRSTAKMSQRVLCLSFVVFKLPSLSMTDVHGKNFIALKIAVSDMNGQFSLHFKLLFTVTCFK